MGLSSSKSADEVNKTLDQEMDDYFKEQEKAPIEYDWTRDDFVGRSFRVESALNDIRLIKMKIAISQDEKEKKVLNDIREKIIESTKLSFPLLTKGR